MSTDPMPDPGMFDWESARRPSDRAIAQAFWAFVGDSHNGTTSVIESRARELDATAAPVVVGEDMVERAYSAYGQRCWSRGETASAVTKEDMRAALTAALAGD